MHDQSDKGLERTLGPLMLWGLGVGYVISGMYFGWNLGLPHGGTLGLGLATFFISFMYIFFTFSYTELSCAIPKAGGAFDYANKALGPDLGFVTGISQLIEFVFAPPAIAFAIGAYFHEFFSGIPVTIISLTAFVIFTFLNISGVKAAASFELFITIFAVFELLLFSGVTLTHFKFDNLTLNSFPHGFSGLFASIPFAIWFFLGIEGVANLAEEAIDPQKNIVKGFGWAIFTLIFLCFLTFFSSIGVAGWEAVVYPRPGGNPSDSPLPLALSYVIGKDHFFYHLLITIGLFGLIASFHGIILAAGRVTFEFGRVGYFPKFLGRTHQKFRTPANALLMNMLVGIGALLTGRTNEIITIACFGALSLYILSLITFFKLRLSHPEMPRPFRAPFYPYSQFVALFIAGVSFVAMMIFNLNLGLIFLTLMTVSFLCFKFFISDEKKDQVLIG
jgi:ethanolamine permease